LGSQFKKAHRTHALDLRAGTTYPRRVEGRRARDGAAPDDARAAYEELCELVPDPAARASLLGVAGGLDAIWRRGARTDLLQIHLKTLRRALERARCAQPRRHGRPSGRR
jgi:hypothetical protein